MKKILDIALKSTFVVSICSNFYLHYVQIKNNNNYDISKNQNIISDLESFF